MRSLPALLLVLAVVAASFAARDGVAAAQGDAQLHAVHAPQPSVAPLVPAAEPVRVGCKRGIPGLTPTPCSAGVALLTPLPQAWMQSDTAGVDPSRALRVRAHRPKGLLDPPRSA